MERVDQQFERSDRHHHHSDHQRHVNNRRSWGMLLIVVGLVLFANAFDLIPVDVKEIILSWQMLLIVIGVISMINNRSLLPGIIIMAIGGFFMINEFWELSDVWRHAFWPIVILFIGVYLIVAPPKSFRPNQKTGNPVGDSRDFIDEVAVFSGGDRIITSKNFKGGRIVSVFGGSDINLMNAQLAEGVQVIETTNVFGGANIIVPAGWTVKVEVTAIFGGFSDKRPKMPNLVYDEKTMLVIRGVAIFGGGEVKSFGF